MKVKIMRSFIVLSLIALASADVSHLSGYNYQAGSGGGLSGGCDNVSGSGCGGGDSGFAASNLSPSVSAGNGGDYGGDGGSIGVGPAGYDKEFFTYSADESDFEPQGSENVANSLKKNLRVVFVKGPENQGLENAIVNLAKHAADQRTAIYVLNKQADIGDLANKLNQINNQNHNKPEVHFVKYRTPEDAYNAQNQIQNQYAGLGGSSRSHDGGVAPVLDFASKGSSGHVYSAGSNGAGHGGYTHSHPSNVYVPPANTYVPPAAVPSHSYIPPAAPSNTYIPPAFFRSLRF